MDLILLLGNNQKASKILFKKIKKKLQKRFDKIITIHYLHWGQVNRKTINLDLELERIVKKIDNNIKNDYIIIAKTVGVLVALKGIYEGLLSPKKCIFIGIPIIWARLNDLEIDLWLERYNNIPTLIFQKQEDPSMEYKDLKRYMERMNKKHYEIKKIEGSGLYYDEIEKYFSLFQDYLNSEL